MSWFDYRLMEPGLRDLVFGREWLLAYTKWKVNTGVDVEFDDRGVEYKVPPPYRDAAEMLADREFWPRLQKLRAFVDKKSMPYNYFWRYVFEVITADPTEYGPVIGSFADVNMKNIVSEMFTSESEVHLILSDNELFQVGNYQGLQVQNDYVKYISVEVYRRHPQNPAQYLEDLARRGQLKKEWLGDK